MALISSYVEEIYERKETELKGMDYSAALSYLISDGKGNIIRKQSTTIRDIAKGLAKPFEIKEEIGEADNLESLRRIKSTISSAPSTAQEGLIDFYNDKEEQLQSTEKREGISTLQSKITQADDFDDLRKLRKEAKATGDEATIDSVQDKMDKIAKEMQDLGRKNKEQREVEEIIDKISEAETLSQVNKLDNQLGRYSIDTGEARGLISQKIDKIEEQKERDLEVMRKKQSDSARRRQEQFEEGVTDEF